MSASPKPSRRRSHHAQPWAATSAAAYVGDLPEDDDPLLRFAPFIHPQPKRTSITPDLQRRFVATLAATGIVTQAARSIGKSMEALYMLRRRPGAEGFAAAWDEAARWGMDRLSDCALERALSRADYSGFACGSSGRADERPCLAEIVEHGPNGQHRSDNEQAVAPEACVDEAEQIFVIQQHGNCRHLSNGFNFANRTDRNRF